MNFSEFSELTLPQLTVDKKELFLSKKQSNPKLIYLLINEFKTSNEEPFFTGLEFKIEEDKKELNEFANTLWELGKYLIEKYENKGRNDWSHVDQRRVLEKAIRLFEKVDVIQSKKNKNDDVDKSKKNEIDVSLYMAKAYLYRSKIIRTKEFTVPPKKIEALKKALELCNKSQNIEADHIAGLVALELDRCDLPDEKLEECGIKNHEIIDLLKKATEGDSVSGYSIDKIIEFYQMRVRLEEITKGNYQAEILKNVLFSINDKDVSKVEDGLELEKYKVAIANDNDQQELYFNKLYTRLKHKGTPFSHPLWNDTIKFIRYLYKSQKTNWKRLAYLIWDLAEEKSLKISTLHIRWYWSRQRDLYDLAFLAAIEDENLNLANEIADSMKNRPALTWKAIEDINNESLNKVLEQYAKALGRHYIKGLSKTKSVIPKDIQFESNVTKTDSIIVQFYLVQLEEFKDDKKGFALIYNNGWTYNDEYRFNYNLIWNKYQEWQSLYFSIKPLFRDGSSACLKELCEISGNELKFLFEFKENILSKIFQKRNMIFIPHDFLHRLPIHSAIYNKSILCSKYRCTYWPTLAMKPRESMKKNNKTQRLQYFSKKEDENDLTMLDSLDEKFDINIKNALLENFIKLKEDPPGMLIILCHGKADTINPFFSKLLLKEDLTLIELASQDSFFSGNYVYIGACETDLMSPLDSPIDEHISIASILLQKGASEVLGTIWETKSDVNIYLIEKILDEFKKKLKFDPINTIMKGLKKKIKHLINSDNNLYRNMCFKLYKYPI